MTTQANQGANDTTVFQGEAAPKDNQPNADSVLSNLVGEGKKFKTVEDLAKGKAEADAFIEKLKGEVDELRKELQAGLSLKQAIQEVDKRGNQPESNVAPKGSVDPSELPKLVNEMLEQRELEKVREANIKEADRQIVALFNGDRQKSKEFLEKKAAELGVGVNWLADMAATSPKAVMNFLGLETTAPNTAALNNRSVNTDAQTFAPNAGPVKGSKAYYDKIRKENPSLYFSPKVQQEIFEAAKAGKYV